MPPFSLEEFLLPAYLLIYGQKEDNLMTDKIKYITVESARFYIINYNILIFLLFHNLNHFK